MFLDREIAYLLESSLGSTSPMNHTRRRNSSDDATDDPRDAYCS